MKKIILSFFVFTLFLINTNETSAQVYINNYNLPVTVSGPEVNSLPLCDSTYRLNCPFNVRCRNINGMIAFACPAAFANQPLNTNYTNTYNTNYVNNNTNYQDYNYNNYSNTNYNIGSNYNFVNSPVYFENGSYYTNPVVRPYYDLATTYNNSNYHYSY